MADPANSNLSVWLRCGLCGGSYSKLSEFIQHKQEWHLAEFQRTNTHSIVFEEVIIPTDNNQKFNEDFAIIQETRSITATVSAQELCQSSKHVQGRQEPGDFSASVPVTNQDDGSSEGTSETVPLPLMITFEKNVEHEADKTDAISVPSVYYHNDDSRDRQSNNEPSSGIDADDKVHPVLYYIDGQLVMEIPLESPNSEQQSTHDSNNTELIPIITETKAECSTNVGSYSSNSFESFTNGSPQVQIKRLTLQRIKSATRSERKSAKTTQSSKTRRCRRRRQKAPSCSCMLKKNSSNRTRRNHNHNHHHSSLPTDLKPYKCPQPGCIKVFKTRGYYNRHTATHTTTNSNPVTGRQRGQVFACEICKTGFSGRFSLKRHNTALHQWDGLDKRFKCTTENCFASFHWKKSLNMHKKGHQEGN